MEKKNTNPVYSSVLQELEEKALLIIKEGEKQAKKIISSAEEEANEKINQIMKKAKEEARTQVRRLESLAEIQIKRAILNHRAKLLDDIYQRLNQKIKHFTTTPEYKKVLEKFIQEGVKNITQILQDRIENQELVVFQQYYGVDASGILRINKDKRLMIYLRRNDKELITREFLDSLQEKYGLEFEILDADPDSMGGVLIKTADDSLTFDKRIETILSVHRDYILNFFSTRLWEED
ncbi:MAG: V-type ATP synthase subunit E [Candidatus Helarchaeota archaeon]